MVFASDASCAFPRSPFACSCRDAFPRKGREIQKAVQPVSFPCVDGVDGVGSCACRIRYAHVVATRCRAKVHGRRAMKCVRNVSLDCPCRSLALTVDLKDHRLHGYCICSDQLSCSMLPYFVPSFGNSFAPSRESRLQRERDANDHRWLLPSSGKKLSVVASNWSCCYPALSRHTLKRAAGTAVLLLCRKAPGSKRGCLFEREKRQNNRRGRKERQESQK